MKMQGETLAGALIAARRLWLCCGGETTLQTAPTEQNKISNNSGGKFLQYEPHQIINQSSRNSVVHLVANLRFVRPA